MAGKSVKMTKDQIGATATATVSEDAVDAWKAKGWKVKSAPKGKAKE